MVTKVELRGYSLVVTAVPEQTFEFNGLEWEWLPHLNPKCVATMYSRTMLHHFYNTFAILWGPSLKFETANFFKMLLKRD